MAFSDYIHELYQNSVDQYYYGMNPKRFIQVETAFFWRWWNEQNEFMKNLVKDLVAEGMKQKLFIVNTHLLVLFLNMKS